jgi:predicted phage terminase large subunit-like protein
MNPDNLKLRQHMRSLSKEEWERYLNRLSSKALDRLNHTWEIWARDKQLPPTDPDWAVWLLLCGRGFGKTRTIIEWMRSLVQQAKVNKSPIRIAIVGATHNDVYNTLIKDGVFKFFPPEERPEIQELKHLLQFPDGSQAQWFTAQEPDRLRGPQFHFAICDELAAWAYLEDTWRNLRMMLRLGKNPRIAIATTPKPLPFLRALAQDPTVRTVFGSTFENQTNLSQAFFETTIKDYQGTRYGAQEIYGQLLPDFEGALFERRWFKYQALDLKDCASIVVSLDPAMTTNPTSDLTGIIVAAKRLDGSGYVLEDLSGKHTPDEWAAIAIDKYHQYRTLCPTRILAEVNQGGDLVEKILRLKDPHIRYTAVHASKGKVARAEPVAALYQQGRIYHPLAVLSASGKSQAALDKLEEQLVSFLPGASKSPDRMDALVWAFSYLLLGIHPPARGAILNRLGWF